MKSCKDYFYGLSFSSIMMLDVSNLKANIAFKSSDLYFDNLMVENVHLQGRLVEARCQAFNHNN